MAKVEIYSTRNFLQAFMIEFEFPYYSSQQPDVDLIKITGMTGHPEYVDPQEFFTAMKELLSAGKAERKNKK